METPKINPTIISSLEEIIKHTRNEEDKKKASLLLKRSKNKRSKLTEDECIDFFIDLNYEELNLPNV